MEESRKPSINVFEPGPVVQFAAAAINQIREKKHRFSDLKKASHEFNIGYQQGLAEARQIIRELAGFED